MASGCTSIVVVENLPLSWSSEHLRYFVGALISEEVKEDGVHTFKGIAHTALLRLEKPVSVESVDQVELTQMPFIGQTLQMRAVMESTQTVLVHYKDPDMSADNIWYSFGSIDSYGTADVEDVRMYPEALVAVVRFSEPEGVTTALSKGDYHIRKRDKSIAVELEPYYEEFHLSLLQEIQTKARQKEKKPSDTKASGFPVGTPQRTMPTDDERLQREQFQILKEKAEKLESENEKLKNVVTVTLPVPSYQLRLLKDFRAHCESGCQVKFLEKDVLFTGTKEQCQQGKIQLLEEIQRLVVASIQVSPTIQKLLESPKGVRYLNDVVQRCGGCSFFLQPRCILCAAVDEESLSTFTRELEAFSSCQTCKIPLHLSQMQDFTTLRMKLENEYLVLLTSDNAEAIQVEGLNEDVKLVIKELEEFIDKNHADEIMFSIDGAMEAEACKKWYSKELEAAKQMIRQTGEILDESTGSRGYTLKFQCRQNVLMNVMEMLNDIKDGIISTQVDLDKEFPQYSDRALVVNGLLEMGISPFCALYKELLIKKSMDCLGDIELPAKCALPHFRFQSRKKGGRGHGGQSLQSPHHGDGNGRQHFSHRSSHRDNDQPSVPCSYTMGNTTITVKAGDITTEQVAAAVSVIPKDLNPMGTSIAAAFLLKCPSIAQDLQADSQASVDPDSHRILVTPSTGGTLPMNTVYHVVLRKRSRRSVPTVVKELVHQCLTLALSSGITSIAFPPLGVGKRFGYGRYTVANAMMTTFQVFLKSHPNSFQNISIVVADSNAIGRFAEVLKNLSKDTMPAAAAGTPVPPATGTTPAVPAATGATPAVPAATPVASASAAAAPAATSDNDSSASEDSDGDVVLETVEEDLPKITKGKFRALIITKQAQNSKEAIDILLSFLKTTFLHHDTILDDSFAKFHKLETSVLQRIANTAVDHNVHFSLHGEGLRLCGTKENVLTMKTIVQAAFANHLQQQGKRSADRRKRLGLPIDTEQMPSYWKIWKKVKDPVKVAEKARTAWEKKQNKLASVTPEEQAAVVKLVNSTWDAQKAGAGKDARNLTHTGIKVKDVKRLENPGMWSEYCHRREQMIQQLEYETDPSKTCCTPVEKLPSSSGPLMTTANIAKGSALTRDIYPQVNEHYLFHGTKQEALNKIYSQGLDFRMANDKTMLGRGVYTAESSTKADQYTDPKTARSASDQDLTMILVRVLLGEPFLSTQPNPEKFKRPPCRSCSKTGLSCSCGESRLYDSIIDNGGRIFREFVIYNEHVCYPEYFITYNRVEQKAQ